MAPALGTSSGKDSPTLGLRPHRVEMARPSFGSQLGSLNRASQTDPGARGGGSGHCRATQP
jgi:hypothetical protein